VVDYFTKWIEAEPLANITATNVQSFVWKIRCRFGVPYAIITDNERQFIDRKLGSFFAELVIKHITSSVEHPQTNGQAEAANKVVLSQLKKRLGVAKGKWADELLEVLWPYRCTPQTFINESPYNLTYGTNAKLPVEIGGDHEKTAGKQVTQQRMYEKKVRPLRRAQGESQNKRGGLQTNSGPEIQC